MEKKVKNNIDIVIKNKKSGDFVFEIKNIENISHQINDEIKSELSFASDNSIVVYTNDRIINLNNLYLNTNPKILE